MRATHFSCFVLALDYLNLAYPASTTSTADRDTFASEALHASKQVLFRITDVAFARVLNTDVVAFRHEQLADYRAHIVATKRLGRAKTS